MGARPQFIKMAPVRLALHARGHEEISVHTGQHYDPGLSDIFFQPLGLPRPRHNLEVGSGTHGEQTARMLSAAERTMIEERPDGVVAIGDTNSTLAGALAAVKLHIPVAHIEAGLRSFNRRMPEEHNRVCTDHLSDRLYYSTRAACENLVREGLLAKAVRSGDVTLDSVRLFSATDGGPELALLLDRVGPRPFAVLTLHRAENTDDADRFRRLWGRINEMAWPVVFPIHPRTREVLARLALSTVPSVHVSSPIEYATMLGLLRRASLLLTDSGGLQKEAYFLGVPCLTLREETEWVETIEAGWNRLYDLSTFPPIDAEAESRRHGVAIEEYGNGHAAERIVEDLESWLGSRATGL